MIDRGPRRPVSTPALLTAAAFLIAAANVLVETARAVGGWVGGVVWFLGALALGVACGVLAEWVVRR